MLFLDHDLIFKLVLAIFASTGFWAFITQVVIRKIDAKDAKTQMLIGIAHDRIYYLCSTYIERGYITVEEFDNLQYLYKPYHDGLHANGTGKRLFEECEKLPLVKEKKEGEKE